MRTLERVDLARLFAALHARGMRVIGPRVRDHAVVLDEVESVDDLPVGVSDEQAPGRYRLHRRDDERAFGYVVGPHSWKQHLLPARETLYRAERRPDGKVGFTKVAPAPDPTALLGVRACDLAAIRIHDRVLGGGPYREPRYFARREDVFLIGVHCTEPGATCFCASMGTGPRVGEGADLVLAEKPEGFLVEAHTDRGRELLDALPTRAATEPELHWLDDALAAAEQRMGRSLDTRELPGRLFAKLDHPRWARIAERCLACGSCTHVCPTCFCSTTEDHSSLDGSSAEKVRLWESCFSVEHANIHAHNYRPRIDQRYRQWATHKLGAWVSQIGESGCVGCGRCITWCPVGIDLTEEVAALCADPVEPVSMPVAVRHTHHEEADLVPRVAHVIATHRETADVTTLHIRATGLEVVLPGQFCQLSLPGIGEAPISVSGTDGFAVEHTIRAVGAVTRALADLAPGAELGLRGPYGRPWPLDELAGHPVVVVAGGIGLAPLRGAIREMLGRPERYPEVRLLYGTRTPNDVIFVHEMLHWAEQPSFRLRVTVDQAGPGWHGHLGVVPRLLRRGAFPSDSRVLLCGPDVMMYYSIEALRRLGVPDEHVWVTRELHMRCATGFCGRCQLGPWFVCKDGPVFRYDQLAMLHGKEGF